jgi:hypothetical protein
LFDVAFAAGFGIGHDDDQRRGERPSFDGTSATRCTGRSRCGWFTGWLGVRTRGFCGPVRLLAVPVVLVGAVVLLCFLLLLRLPQHLECAAAPATA